MNDQHDYYEYLRGRSARGLWYRTKWLYPRLCRHLHGQVLDVGCGIGDMVRFRPRTTGVDINPETVAFCQKQGLDVRLMEPDRLPFTEQAFGGVVLDNVLEHLQYPQSLLAEVRRVLAPGGTFVVGVPGRRGYAADPDHKIFYSAASLVACVTAAGFDAIDLLHLPFRFPLIDRVLRIQAIYGVFRRKP